MKKIISFLSAIAMVCTLFTSIALADENNYFSITEVSNENNVVTLHVTGQTNMNLRTISITFNMADAIDKGLDLDKGVTVTKGADALAGSKSVSKKTIAFNATSSTGELTGTIDLGTIAIDKSTLTDSFNFVISATKAQDADKKLVTTSFSTDTVTSYTVTKPAAAAKDAVEGKEVNGSKMFSTDAAVAVPTEGSLNVKITKSGEGSKAIDENISASENVLGAGTTKILPIVSYQIGRSDVAVGDVFTIVIKNGDTTVGTWIYTAK